MKLFLLACLVFSWVVGVAAGDDSTKVKSKAPAEPLITHDPNSEVNAGEPGPWSIRVLKPNSLVIDEPGGEISFEFEIHNHTDLAIDVMEAKASCSCMAVRFDRENLQISPAESIRGVATVGGTGFGDRSVTPIVQTSSKAVPIRAVEIKYRVENQASVKDVVVDLGPVRAGSVVAGKTEILGLEILDQESSPNLIATTNHPDGVAKLIGRHVLFAGLASEDVGTHSAEVLIREEAGDSFASVKFTWGVIDSSIIPLRKQLHLGVIADASEVRRTISVPLKRVMGEGGFRVVSASFAGRSLDFKQKFGASDTISLLELTLPKAILLGAAKEDIIHNKLAIEIANEGTLSIPVFATVSPSVGPSTRSSR